MFAAPLSMWTSIRSSHSSPITSRTPDAGIDGDDDHQKQRCRRVQPVLIASRPPSLNTAVISSVICPSVTISSLFHQNVQLSG